MKFKGYDLKSINSATKYPSILTYHVMGKKGVLQTELNIDFSEETDLNISEKIDGTNSRIVLFPDGDYLIGSREEILYAKGDRIETPTLNIVSYLKDVAEMLSTNYESELIKVFYFETYGGRITKNSKQYTSDNEVSFRLFDICTFEETMFNKPPEELAKWRDSEGQSFEIQSELIRLTKYLNIDYVPYLGTVSHIPTDINDTFDMLKNTLPETLAGIGCGGESKPEGIIIKSNDRSKIAKIRYEDYNRWLRSQN